METLYACSILSAPPLRQASALHTTRHGVRAPEAPTPPVELPRQARPSQGGKHRVPPEDLSPIAPGRYRLMAWGWISGVLLVGLIILLIAR